MTDATHRATPDPLFTIAPPPAALLGPLQASPRDLEAAVHLARANPRALAQTLRAHRVATLWGAALRAGGVFTELPESLQRELVQAEQLGAARALQQGRLAAHTTRALHASGLPHAFMKGIHLRRVLYARPELRPADDVDLLVPPPERARAVAALTAAGLTLRPKRGPLTHEQSLEWHGVGLDLHWHVFRPGRARLDPTPNFVTRAQLTDGLPVLDDLATSVLLTVGGALGDYVTGRLLRALELDRWLRADRLPWLELTPYLTRLGLRTAAWTMLVWTAQCFDSPIPAAAWRDLAPSRVRQLYLRAWLRADPARVYARNPLLARVGFSLALQDHLHDTARAAVQRATARWTARAPRHHG